MNECVSSNAEEGDDDDGDEKTEPHFTSIPYGFQQIYHYTHSKKQTELVDVTVNTRTKQFILLDSRGITAWTKDAISNAVTRSLSFPKYQNHLLRNVIFAKKYNVYFCLAHDFSLKVLNKDFEETCTADSDLSSVMFMVFNPVRDELITGGVKGVKIWEFKQIADRIWTEIRPMANYGLFLKKQLESVGGAWVRKLELNERLQQLYCCSDIDVSCYDMDGKFLSKIPRAHSSRITGCKYSHESKMLVTSSFDCEVKVWSLTGGLVHTFRGHSRAVTNILLHPDSSTLVLTSSLDGTVRMWSLDIMEEVYCIVMSAEGIIWMGLIADRSLWTATSREIFIWNIDQAVHFYALVRSRVTTIQVAQCAGKTSRVLAVGEDSSVRLVSMRDRRNLSTVLPPPSLSPLQKVLAVSYNRACNLVYLLINPQEIWVYTMRTDPACRTAVWDVSRIQERSSHGHSPGSYGRTQFDGDTSSSLTKSALTSYKISGATSHGQGPCPRCPCTSLTTLSAHIVYSTKDGPVSPIQTNFLVLGLQDGRVVFLDPVKFGCRYCELNACKNAIVDLQYDSTNSLLIARSNLREDDMVQLWSLPQLDLKHEVLAHRGATCYAYARDTFMVGHLDGSVAIHEFTPDNPLGVLHRTPVSDGQADHLAPVLSVDSCPALQLFVSCSGDGVIKVWNLNKVLCAEIVVEDSLTCARFLNQRGDLLIGYKNHLFSIHHDKVLASFSRDDSSRQDFLDSESDIYEDPAVRYEGAAPNPDPLTLETYLVPFNLDFSESFLGGEASPQQSEHSSDQDDASDSNSGYSMAPTDLYVSPTCTPRRLSYVDLIVPGDCITSDALRNQSVTIITKRKFGRPMLEILQTERSSQPLDELTLPRFGTSPGPSPSPSPPSTPSDINLSERESDSAGEEDMSNVTEDKKVEMGEVAIAEKPVTVVTKERVEQKETPQPVVAEESPPRPRFGLSNMRIDAKSLIKNSGVSLSKASRLESTMVSSGKKQDSLEVATINRRIPSPKKKIEKKKKRGGDPTRTGRRGSRKPSLPNEADTKNVSSSKKKSTTKSFQKSVHSVIKSKTVMKATAQPVPIIEQPESVETTQPSVTNLVMDGDTTRELYRSSSPAASREAKPVSIFSNYKGPGKTSSTGTAPLRRALGSEVHPPTGLSEVDVTKGTAGPSMGRAVSRAAIVQKYNPLERLNLTTGSREGMDLSVSTPNQPLQPPDRARSASTNEVTEDGVTVPSKELNPLPELPSVAQDHPSVQERTPSVGRTPTQDLPGSPSSAAGSSHSMRNIPDGDYIDYEMESVPPQLGTSGVSRELVDSLADSKGARHADALSGAHSSLESFADVSASRSDERELDTTMGSLSIDAMSRPSTAMSFAEGALYMLSSCGEESSFAMSRPLSVASGSVAPSPELQEIARLEEALVMRSNLREGSLARPNTAKGERTVGRYPTDRRPHTAGEHMHVTFLDELGWGTAASADGIGPDAEQFRMYTSPSPEIFRYHKNDGLDLKVDWQDKMIERHRMMKVQKELRSRSAAEKRQLLDLRRRQKRKALIGHRDCTDDGGVGGQLGHRTEQSYDMRRSQSAPPMGCGCIPSRPPSRVVDGLVSPLLRRRESTTATKTQAPPEKHGDRDVFKSELPYRFRLGSQEVCSDQDQATSGPSHGAVGAARSRPTSLHRAPQLTRPHTSKSIPSKARRFIFIPSGQSESHVAQVTPLEVHLLGQRFPNSKEHLRSRSSLLRQSSSVSGHKIIPAVPEQKPIFT